jgi:NAD(P) transhydrogenase subunit alpha
LKVRAPQGDEIQKISANTTVIAMFDPYRNTELEQFATQQISAFALELLPRTLSRAQNMDVLSQANLSGYKSVLLAANEYQRMFPMLMTAAGTVKPARVVVMGVGVAGLQAIATAKRLGAVVEATDLRPTAKDQVESLGEMARCANVRRRTAACCRCSEEWLWLDARRTVHQGSGCNC